MFLTTAETWRQATWALRDGRTDGQGDVVPVSDGTPFGRQQKKIPPFVTTQVDLEGIMPSDISQAEREKWGKLAYT